MYPNLYIHVFNDNLTSSHGNTKRWSTKKLKYFILVCNTELVKLNFQLSYRLLNWGKKFYTYWKDLQMKREERCDYYDNQQSYALIIHVSVSLGEGEVVGKYAN